jgi:hypothetical protein
MKLSVLFRIMDISSGAGGKYAQNTLMNTHFLIRDCFDRSSPYYIKA